MNDLMSKIKAKLDQSGIKHELISLPEDLPIDVESHMKFHGQDMRYAMPNMVFKTDKGLVVVQRRGDTQIDNKKLRNLLGVYSLVLASGEDLENIGLQPGIVPPLGYDIPIYMDQKVLENDKVYTGTGDRLFSIKLNPHDLIKVNKAKIADFTKIDETHGRKRILTGDRPTGRLHLGHYIGSLRNRVRLQDEYECFFIIADLHTLTTRPEKSSDLKENIHQMVLDYLSVGIDPQKATIYIQSQISEVGELAIIFGNLVAVPRLERVPTLKDVMRDSNITIPSYGLLGYPVLQSADILMPRAHLVPVGKDQASHIEVTREIAREFNRVYGQTLPVPEALIPDDIGTLPGTDGKAKMSKSAGNVINISESAEEVEKKVMSMYTDPTRIHPTDPGHVEGNPVFIYLHAFGSSSDHQQITKYKEAYQKGQVGDIEVKKYLVKVLNNFLEPIRKKRAEYEQQPELVDKILKEGTQKARGEAQKTLGEVKRVMKLDYFE